MAFITKTIENLNAELIVCDHCGAGIDAHDPEERITNWKGVHENCTLPAVEL